MTTHAPYRRLINTPHLRAVWIVAFIPLLLAGCASWHDNHSAAAQHAATTYVADIHPINAQLTPGAPGSSHSDISGKATFTIKDGMLHITVRVQGLVPGTMHLQHIHGFTNGQAVTSVASDADTNGDGIIDLIETHPYTGVTLIPFNANPIALKIKTNTYPVVNNQGVSVYHKTVSLAALKQAVRKKYGIKDFSLDKCAVYIHGLPSNITLPSTVQSLPGVPASVTVPIAYGLIHKAENDATP